MLVLDESEEPGQGTWEGGGCAVAAIMGAETPLSALGPTILGL